MCVSVLSGMVGEGLPGKMTHGLRAVGSEQKQRDPDRRTRRCKGPGAATPGGIGRTLEKPLWWEESGKGVVVGTGPDAPGSFLPVKYPHFPAAVCLAAKYAHFPSFRSLLLGNRRRYLTGSLLPSGVVFPQPVGDASWGTKAQPPNLMVGWLCRAVPSLEHPVRQAEAVPLVPWHPCFLHVHIMLPPRGRRLLCAPRSLSQALLLGNPS